MKFFNISFLLSLFLISSFGHAEDTVLSSVIINETKKPAPTSTTVDQLFTLQLGGFKPESLKVDNGSSAFNYEPAAGNERASSILGEFGWALKLFEPFGAFYFEENIGFSAFHGNTSQAVNSSVVTSASYTLLLFGLDTRIQYSLDFFPWKRLIPFLDGGYQYTLFYQPGSSGFESAQGGVGNPVAGAGLRFWINRTSSLAQNGLPFFITAKANRIFPQPGNDLNLGSTSFFGGVSVGL